MLNAWEHLAEGDYFMNKKEEDKTIFRIVVLVASILLMKIGKEYLGMILFALFVINDIILIIKNYLDKWRKMIKEVL